MSESSSKSESAILLEKLDEEKGRMDFLYALGKKVSHEMKRFGVNPNNPYEMDSYFECLPPQHEEALAFYEDEKTKYEGIDRTTLVARAQQTCQLPAEALDAETSARKDPPVEKLLDDWIAVIRGSMKASSFPEYERMGRFFGRVITHLNKAKSPPIGAVDEHLIREYKEILKKTPKSVKTEGYSIEALINKTGPRKSASHLFSLGHSASRRSRFMLIVGTY